MKQTIRKQIDESIKVKRAFSDELIDSIEKTAQEIIKHLKNGGKLLICGNGGSAADSQHFAAELVSKFKMERKALPAIALTINTSTITAISNDYDFNRIFSRQIEAFGNKKDVLFAISTSGNSENIIEAISQAKKQNIFTIGLTGSTEGKMKKHCDLIIQIPSTETPRIQEAHIMVIHILCDLIEQAFS